MEMEPLAMTPVRHVAMSTAEGTLKGAAESETTSFVDYLKDAILETDVLIKKSEALDTALATGEVEDISQVIIAAQKADLALQLTLQVRNRAVSAYQELMRMQV